MATFMYLLREGEREFICPSYFGMKRRKIIIKKRKSDRTRKKERSKKCELFL